jgi:hypothetical protein
MRVFFATTAAQLMMHQNEDLNHLFKRFQESNPKLSPKDLTLLHTLFPERFKQLFYETVVCPSGELHVLTSQSNYEDIAEGCYAALAVPGILKPMEINGLKLIDGGTYRQMPFDAFDFPLPNQKPDNTLVFIFTDPPYYAYENTSSYKALYEDKITERFYEPFVAEGFIRDYLMPYAIGLTAEYKNTENWNENYSNLARHYALNTVEINACGLLQPHFPKALQQSRQYYASGFLDTMNYLINHELGLSECDASEFYITLCDTFEAIYKAFIKGAGNDLANDLLWINYQEHKNKQYKEDGFGIKACCAYVHDALKANVESIPGLLLTYAVEFNNGVLSAQSLFSDVEQIAYKYSGWSDALNNKFHFFINNQDNRAESIRECLLMLPKFKIECGIEPNSPSYG